MPKPSRPIQFPAIVATRVDQATADALGLAAAERGIRLGDLARDILMRGAGASTPVALRRRFVPNADELARIDASLGHISGNLQRLFTLAQTAGYDPAGIENLRREMMGARAEIRSIVGGPRDGTRS